MTRWTAALALSYTLPVLGFATLGLPGLVGGILGAATIVELRSRRSFWTGP